MYPYGGSLLAVLVCMLLSAAASAKVKNTFAKYDRVRTRSGMNGHDTAVRLLLANGIRDISVGSVDGQLTDHYHPAKNRVNLSESTYGSASIAAVAVAAHEIGHVVQGRAGYLPYRLRTAIVPAVNLGSRLAMPLVLVGLLLETGVFLSRPSDLGFTIAMIGVVLYAGSVVFALVTLPVEYNASRRAREMLLSAGILTEAELPAARKVLSAAAMTYVASTLTAIVYFLRFLIYVLSAFGRRDRRH